MRLRNPLQIARTGKQAEAGNAMVEFAMIAPVFFTLLFASLETGLAYFANMTLQNGVMETSRLIRTGQAQNSNMSQAAFRNTLCAEISPLLSCDGSKLYIDIRSFTSFGNAGVPEPIDGAGEMSGGMDNYQLGQSSQSGTQTIILYRAFYKWQLFTPLFAQYFANMNGNIRLLSSSAAFKNEPF
jgi:Flp pilus assembly protein TadG